MTASEHKKTKGKKIYTLAQMGVMTAVICVLAPLSIPIGAVPISFTNLAIMLSVYLLGWKKGTICTICYILIGMIGLPVYSGFAGGVGKLLGPTGGFIFGFILLAAVSGLAVERCQCVMVHFMGFIAGTILLYALGTAWFCYQAGVNLSAAMSACVYPFIPGDFIKILVSMALGPIIKNGLIKAGLL